MRSRAGCRARRIRVRAPGTCSGCTWPARARRAATSTGPTSSGPRTDRAGVEWPGRNAEVPGSGPAFCTPPARSRNGRTPSSVEAAPRRGVPAWPLPRCPPWRGRPPVAGGTPAWAGRSPAAWSSGAGPLRLGWARERLAPGHHQEEGVAALVRSRPALTRSSSTAAIRHGPGIARARRAA